MQNEPLPGDGYTKTVVHDVLEGVLAQLQLVVGAVEHVELPHQPRLLLARVGRGEGLLGQGGDSVMGPPRLGLSGWLVVSIPTSWW